MGGAFLVAGGATWQAAIASLREQMAEAAEAFGLSERGEISLAVSSDQPLPADGCGYRRRVVSPEANVDWQGQHWPFVAAVWLHS